MTLRPMAKVLWAAARAGAAHGRLPRAGRVPGSRRPPAAPPSAGGLARPTLAFHLASAVAFYLAHERRMGSVLHLFYLALKGLPPGDRAWPLRLARV
jgi:hypothetical protein